MIAWIPLEISSNTACFQGGISDSLLWHFLQWEKDDIMIFSRQSAFF